MQPPATQTAALLARAKILREAGDPNGATELLRRAVVEEPGHPGSLNALALAILATGRPAEAIPLLSEAISIDPSGLPLRINLADALAATGDIAGALVSLNEVLERDPYMPPALIRKAQLLERVHDSEGALRAYRALIKTLPDETFPPPAFAAAIEHARRLVAVDGEARLARIETALQEREQALGPRGRGYLEQLCGLRRVFAAEPTGPHFPFLPAVEMFAREQMPWLATLEAAFAEIRDELLALWREDAEGFNPYVRFDPTAPVNQWTELNHSPRWSAFFLWRDGLRVEENIARCPRTAAAMEKLPLLDVPGKAPTVMFSVLAPSTHIPAHTGVTNTRATVHLPLVVPERCRFRVGSETRTLIEGKAWAFDDTIQHEAWNDSSYPRAILIVDTWNPFLTAEERDLVRLAAHEIRT